MTASFPAGIGPLRYLLVAAQSLLAIAQVLAAAITDVAQHRYRNIVLVLPGLFQVYDFWPALVQVLTVKSPDGSYLGARRRSINCCAMPVTALLRLSG
jgi:hypothetical protein